MAYLQGKTAETRQEQIVGGYQSLRTPLCYQKPTFAWGFLWRAVQSFCRILRESWFEIRSCYQRIRLISKRGAVYSLSTGRAFLQSPCQGVVANITSPNRIQGIERLLSLRPWASPEDLRMFLFAWELGRECALRNYVRLAKNPLDIHHW